MAASKVKELLDELAATLAELGMLDEEGAAEEAGENTDGTPVEGERSAVEAVEARQAKYDSLLAKAVQYCPRGSSRKRFLWQLRRYEKVAQ